MTERKQTCASCRHWDAIAESKEGRGLCRRRSPRWHPADEFGGSTIAEWPQSRLGDWCGEYEYSAVGATAKVREIVQGFPGVGAAYPDPGLSEVVARYGGQDTLQVPVTATDGLGHSFVTGLSVAVPQ